MTPDQFQRVRELFSQAVELPAGKRGAFLAEACGGDAEVRADVESLLEHHGQAGDAFLRTKDLPQAPKGHEGQAPPETMPAAPAHDAPPPPAELPPPGPRIDGYEFTRELSRGGQGIVYQAIQKSTKRKVAVKVLHEGPASSKTAQRRFEREIELIAQLRHPNIIGIFHSGVTPDGRPFYVMDYLRGTPLQQYVREKKLTLEDTLKLFAVVCEAVQHAHTKGVIHRDLKPGNILVDAEGSPKVMDFGLAKLLAGPVETLVSISQQLVGTLPYMSPEQARGNPDEIDTRTDVYALGVILYELLTGHYPYPVVGQIVEVLKHITDTPPTPPSRNWKPDSGLPARSKRGSRRSFVAPWLRRSVASACPIDDEVQTIVMRALTKERERRYQSAGELARDVGHYLAGEPIKAKQDSQRYELYRLALRHKLAVALAGIFLLLGTTTGVAVLEMKREQDATRRREQAVIDLLDWIALARKAATPLELDMIHNSIRKVAEKEFTDFPDLKERVMMGMHSQYGDAFAWGSDNGANVFAETRPTTLPAVTVVHWGVNNSSNYASESYLGLKSFAFPDDSNGYWAPLLSPWQSVSPIMDDRIRNCRYEAMRIVPRVLPILRRTLAQNDPTVRWAEDLHSSSVLSTLSQP